MNSSTNESKLNQVWISTKAGVGHVFRIVTKHGVDVLIVLVTVGWIVLMIGPYRAFRKGHWDHNIAGTAAEWTSAVFTGVAVLAAARLFIVELRVNREGDLRQAASLLRTYATSDQAGNVSLIVENGSTGPFWDLKLRVSTFYYDENGEISRILTAGNEIWRARQLLAGEGIRIEYISNPEGTLWTPNPAREILIEIVYKDVEGNTWRSQDGKLTRA